MRTALPGIIAMRLITFRHSGFEEIGALADADTKIVRLQAAELLRSGNPHPDLQDMLAFLGGGPAAREAGQRAFDFGWTKRPEGVVIERTAVELLPPVPRPESIRDFMVFEQHMINCARRFGMPGWLASLDGWVDRAVGRKATLAYRRNRAWYERPAYYKGNRKTVVGHGARVTIPRYTTHFDYELEFGIFLCK
ncbi:MAG: fumarylacetoacetate hydrolase family protein, partial [Candidatus Acidiferrales bacterium]